MMNIKQKKSKRKRKTKEEKEKHWQKKVYIKDCQLTLILLQLPSRIWAICWFVGGRFCVTPNGDIIVDIALFSLLGVLLKLNARPTLALVRDANLEKNTIWIFSYILSHILMESSKRSFNNIKTFFPPLELIIITSFSCNLE